MTEWPATDQYETMTDSELLDHGIEVIEQRDSDSDDGPDSYSCDLRMEAIREELQSRLKRRRQTGEAEPDSRLDDLDGDSETHLAEILPGDETRRQAST